jgi:hypothetical protein
MERYRVQCATFSNGTPRPSINAIIILIRGLLGDLVFTSTAIKPGQQLLLPFWELLDNVNTASDKGLGIGSVLVLVFSTTTFSAQLGQLVTGTYSSGLIGR